MPLPSRFRDAVVVVLLAGFVFYHGIGRREIRRASEGRVARVAQEMLDRGDWVVPHLNGYPRLQKPPLSSWLVALHATWIGDGTVTVRDALAPAALSATLAALLLYLWLSGLRARGKEEETGEPARAAGMLAALALCMSPGFLQQGRMAELDIHVALFTILAFWSFAQAALQGRRGWWIAFYLALAGGFLAKGHVILVCVLPSLMVWAVWRRMARGSWLVALGNGSSSSEALSQEPRAMSQEPKATSHEPRAKSHEPKATSHEPRAKSHEPFQFSLQTLLLHVIGLALCVALVLAWGIPFLQQSGFTWETFQREGLDRFSEEDTGHVEAWWFYLAHVPLWTLPFFLLLPIAAWRQACEPDDGHAAQRRLWWCWLGANLVLWSCLAAKQRHYAVPWLPPVALLGADVAIAALRETDSAKAWAVWGRRVTVAICALLAVSALGFGITMYVMPPEFVRDEVGWGMVVLGAIAAAGFVWALVEVLREQGGRPLLGWWVGAVFALALYAGSVERDKDLEESPRAFCEMVRKHVPEEAILYDTGHIARPHVLFYLRRNVVTYSWRQIPERVDPPLAGDTGEFPLTNPNAYILVNDEANAKIADWGEDPPFIEVFPGDDFDHSIRRGAHLIRFDRSKHK